MKTKISQEEAIQIITAGKESVIEKCHSVTIVKYEKSGTPVCATFYNKKSKPYSHYRFDTEELRDKYIQSFKEREQRSHESQMETLAQYEEKRKLIVEGTIMVSSWGYEQTNIDFYKVLERKGDFVTIQEIGQKVTYDENFNDRGKCVADPESVKGEPFRKKIGKFASIALESYMSCSIWSGEPLYWSSYA